MGLTPTDWPATGTAILAGETWHGRHGGPDNAFRYGVDYVLWRVSPEAKPPSRLVRRRRLGLFGLSDRDHGRGEADAALWARERALEMGLPVDAMAEIWLLTQPRTLGFVFNPVSFWFFRDQSRQVRAVLAEVNNTFGDRHSYLCALPGWQPLSATDTIRAQKVFHVSPFQEIAGEYRFRFDLQGERLAIVIDHRRGAHGLTATLSGSLQPMTGRSLLAMFARHPLGALRVYGLIHWQAIKLKLKGAPYRTRPTPPAEEVSR